MVTPSWASSSPETPEMAGGGTRKRAGSFRSPSYCIMPTNLVCAGHRCFPEDCVAGSFLVTTALDHPHECDLRRQNAFTQSLSLADTRALPKTYVLKLRQAQ